jgi:hypothetical protein
MPTCRQSFRKAACEFLRPPLSWSLLDSTLSLEWKVTRHYLGGSCLNAKCTRMAWAGQNSVWSYRKTNEEGLTPGGRSVFTGHVSRTSWCDGVNRSVYSSQVASETCAAT